MIEGEIAGLVHKVYMMKCVFVMGWYSLLICCTLYVVRFVKFKRRRTAYSIYELPLKKRNYNYSKVIFYEFSYSVFIRFAQNFKVDTCSIQRFFVNINIIRSDLTNANS